MRKLNRYYYALNEGRRKIERTIDSKIWSAMNTMSNLSKSTQGVDKKPNEKDSKEILLQKYVAGLLTMGVNCPQTVEEITELGSYHLFGEKYIEYYDGDIEDIMNLYRENNEGSLISNKKPSKPRTKKTVDVDTTVQDNEHDFPDYDDVPPFDADDEPQHADIYSQQNDVADDTNYVDYTNAEDSDDSLVRDNGHDFPDYDDVPPFDTDDEPQHADIYSQQNETPIVKHQRNNLQFDMENYDYGDDDDEEELFSQTSHNTEKKNKRNNTPKRQRLSNIDFLKRLGFDDVEFGIPKDETPKPKKKIIRSTYDDELIIDNDFDKIIDDFKSNNKLDNFLKKYFKKIGEKTFGIEKGSYLKYDNKKGLCITEDESEGIMQCCMKKSSMIDKKARFFYIYNYGKPVKLGHVGNDGKYKETEFVKENDIIKPQNPYYAAEVTRSYNNTRELKLLGNIPANTIKDITLPNLQYATPEFVKEFKEQLYIPSLFELLYISKELSPGKYWTSSIIKNGNVIFKKDNNQQIKISIATRETAEASLIVFFKL